jgi:hypothetical protein
MPQCTRRTEAIWGKIRTCARGVRELLEAEGGAGAGGVPGEGVRAAGGGEGEVRPENVFKFNQNVRLAKVEVERKAA